MKAASLWRLFTFSIGGLLIVLIVVILGGAAIAQAESVVAPSSTQPRFQAEPQASSVRRVNIPYFSGSVVRGQAAIFWFGVNEWYQHIPGKNYADVRVGYNSTALQITVTVIDYYLWYKQNAQSGDDLTKYDAVAVYLDTAHDRATTPKSDDYYFLDGSYHVGDAAQYRRQARGSGSSWNTSWSGSWTNSSGMQWSDTGPNNNNGNIDYGWIATLEIPWSSLGLSGPPAQGNVWGLGVQLYDQDTSGGSVLLDHWPETFDPNNPSTWGEMHFGLSQYQPPNAIPQGTTLIRASTPTDNVVEDAWMGGGNSCSSGHNGGAETNHGNEQELFVGSEVAPTHFPCYNKSYLRFSLAGIPPGKAIISATLTLHHWGSAGDPNDLLDENHGHDSFVWLFTIKDTWDESVIHWNNAPLAWENLGVRKITPYYLAQWPGIAYTWDATQAVAEAYAAGQPVNLAIYDSADARNTSKYLSSSEVPDWDVAGRPRLDVTWGSASATLTKSAQPTRATNGTLIQYSLTFTGNGQALSLTDTLPVGLSAPTNITANVGTASYNPSTRQLSWSGTPANGQVVTITYRAAVQVSGPLWLSNTAVLTGGSSASAAVCVDCPAVYLPLIRK